MRHGVPTTSGMSATQSEPLMLRDTNPAEWFCLKDEARNRGGGYCEWCSWRGVDDLHHRTYSRERIETLMAVCRICHSAIHGMYTRPEIFVYRGSLAACGDTGHGVHGDLWQKYLNRPETFQMSRADRFAVKARFRFPRAA